MQPILPPFDPDGLPEGPSSSITTSPDLRTSRWRSLWRLTTAEIISHLTLAGVDPALWLHALETPPDRLYYFNPEEMMRLRLATELN